MNLLGKRFVLEHEIGAGGMARVFLARDEVLERFVAVKILNPTYGGSDVANRFRREGRTAAKLSHPNVVPVYGAGESEFEGRQASYIVMEYVPGGDLKALLGEQGPLPDARLARLGAEVSSGLAHAHEKGVIHRDIKPHNVLIDAHGHPKLADFGIARALDATHVTQTGSYLGTAIYSSPEQLQGEKVTPKSDVYSLGITLYQISTGEVPFTGTPIEIASQHINKTPPEPVALGASLSHETEALILDCLQKDPERRPVAEEVRERLLEAAETDHPNGSEKVPPISVNRPRSGRTRPYSSEDPTTKPPLADVARVYGRERRRRGWILLAAAALLLILLGAAAFALAPREDTETAIAPKEESQQQAIAPEDAEPDVQPAESEEEGAGDEQEDTSGTGGDPSEEDPARVVEEFYQTAVDGDFGTHSATMTSEWRQANFPSQEQFENTYYTLRGLDFAEGPTTVENTGDAAVVTGETIASHDDRTEYNGGTWTLVYQNGEWRIDGWQVGNISTGPPQTR